MMSGSYRRVLTCGHRSRSGGCYFPGAPSGVSNRLCCPFHGNGKLANCEVRAAHGKGDSELR